ncbi:unnamed protein product [Durusdinium trenchii]|uniref:Uncharacterized protein n=1 Tax=Durusdinium trenchii TaxID=1381693 RepID=A0ABP0N2K8_9DINO
METGDPDDVLTLLLLASHPNVNLRAVTITPGSMEQVALVLWMLKEIQLPEVRVGAQEWPKNAEKKCVRGKFYDSFGRIPEHLVEGIESAEQVLLESCDQDTTLLTGGPLHNLGCVLGVPGFTLGRWVAQGGFAGEGVVPSELQLEKFAGKRTCQTWNFNGNISAAEAALESTCILRKVLVSKNVCHRAVYDNRFHLDFVQALEQSERIAAQTTRAVALKLLCSAMQAYRRGEGKKLHDPLAMAAVVDETVCSFREVRVIRDKQGQNVSRAVSTATIKDLQSYNSVLEIAEMEQILNSFGDIVTNASDSLRLHEECDLLSLRLDKVAWNWLWDNVAQLLALRLQGCARDAMAVGQDLGFFDSTPAGQEYFKQSDTRLHFIVEKDDAVAVLGFKWSLGIVSKQLVRTVAEGSTIVMKAVNANSKKMLQRAISCAPRGQRFQWLLKVQVGTQSISPLYWAIQSGNLAAAEAIIQDLLVFRADRERYYYGNDALFERHQDIINCLCREAACMDNLSSALAVLLMLMCAYEPMYVCLMSDPQDWPTYDCDGIEDVRWTYSALGLLAMAVHWFLMVDLAVFSTGLSAFVLVCAQVLSEIGRFLVALIFLLLTFGSAISVLEHPYFEMRDIPNTVLCLFSITILLYEDDYRRLACIEPALLTAVLLFVLASSILLMNLLIAQLNSSYVYIYQDMVGFARLNRAQKIVEALANFNRQHFSTFINSIGLDQPLEFNQGDVGVAGGLQLTEPASEHVVLKDSILRFGGSCSMELEWPEESKSREDKDQISKVESLAKKVLRKVTQDDW